MTPVIVKKNREPEQTRFANYWDIYQQGVQALPEPTVDVGSNPTSGATQGAQTKKTKYGDGSMSPEALVGMLGKLSPDKMALIANQIKKG